MAATDNEVEIARRRTAEAFIDESSLSLNGRPILIYATVVPHNWTGALNGFAVIRQEHQLGPEAEIKWTLKVADRETKAAVKQDAISVVATSCTALLAIVEGSDKDQAFLTALKQVEAYAENAHVDRLGINYDQDAFRSRQKMVTALQAWTHVQCTAFACHDSRFSLGIQFADLLAGAFRYMVSCAFGAPTKVVRIYNESSQNRDEWNLDEFFHVLLRGTIPGTSPSIGDAEEITSEQFMKNAMGTGIILEGNFTPEERAVFSDLGLFYMGCMH